MARPSFPAGRSGALREGPRSKDPRGESEDEARRGAADPESLRLGALGFPKLEWDMRFVAGLGANPDARAPNPEYFEMEGVRDDAQRRALPEDALLAAELASAAAAAAAKAREGEVRDALYLSVVHKFNACGVPLVVDPRDYGASPASPSARPSRHSRHPLGARSVVGALERAVAAAPGAGDASARRRRRRFAEKTRRLQREMLPEGAEALLDEHLESIVADAAAAASAIEQLREEGAEGAAAAEALADAASLARVYGRSARYGYFLRAVSTRVRLERSLEDAASHRGLDAIEPDAIEPDRALLRSSHGVANALRPSPRGGDGAEARTPDAASMWLRASRRDAGMSSKADMASLASNIVGPLPAYPDSVGDWVEPAEETTAWLRAEAPEESRRSRRRLRREKERSAAALGAYQASIGDWIADDHVDDDSGDVRTTSANGGATGGSKGSGASAPMEESRLTPRFERMRFGSGEHLSATRRRREGEEKKPPARRAPPSLSAVVASMDVGLRASLAQIAGEETNAVLRDHVDALFGTCNRSRSATSRWTNPANPPPDSGNASAAPPDALRYLVMEAAAFGAGLHAAEKLGERYDLLHASRDAFEA